MITRSFIIQQHTDQKEIYYTGIYCHWDGHLEHNGKILLEHYSCPDKLEQLMALGDISLLRPLVRKDPDSPDTPHTIAYHRDRGYQDLNSEPARSNSLPHLTQIARESDCEYVYVFDGEFWLFTERGKQFFGMDDGTGFSTLHALDEVIQRLDQRRVAR